MALSADDLTRLEARWDPSSWPGELRGALAWATSMHRRPVYYFVERARHLGLSGELLVDAGCGTGAWSFGFAARFDRVLGIDYKPERIAAARWLADEAGLEQTDFMEGDIRRMPLADNAADAVFCYSVVIDELDIDEVYAAFFRILKPGGAALISLNGLGYQYYTLRERGAADPAARRHGEEAVYNSHVQYALGPLILAIAPARRRRAWWPFRVPDSFPKGVIDPSPGDIVAALGGGADALEAVEAIARDLGPEYIQRLRSDLAAIVTGAATRFSFARAGRGYRPSELEKASRKAGFTRFEWARDGLLSVQPDGSVTRQASPNCPPIHSHDYDGQLRVWEALSWKPG